MITIDKRLKALTLEKGNLEMNKDLENLMSRLPCKTNEEVENFDQDISNNEEFKKTFVSIIYYTQEIPIFAAGFFPAI